MSKIFLDHLKKINFFRYIACYLLDEAVYSKGELMVPNCLDSGTIKLYKWSYFGKQLGL